MSTSSSERISLILAPYHTGIRDIRVGLGPQCILAHGLVGRLEAMGKNVTIDEIASVDDFKGEIGRSFEVFRRVSLKVASAVDLNYFPIILAGNCNTEIGVHAGLVSEDPEMVWFDAHSDLDNAEETTSGYFDGMGASMLTGESWKALKATIPSHRPLPLEKLIYCGVHDLSEGQMRKLKSSPARVVYGKSIEHTLDYAKALSEQLEKSRASTCIVHIDLDCLDTSIGKANEFAAPGGLSTEELLSCVDAIAARRRLVGITIASFNPRLEGGDAIADVAVNAIARLVSKL